MASAQKLKSGSYRVQASKTIDGKKIVKSFTVSPKDCGGDSRRAKNQAERMAREWILAEESHMQNGLTVREALTQYI